MLKVCCQGKLFSLLPVHAKDINTILILIMKVYCGLSSGLAMLTLTTIFLPVSGAHISPAVSLAAALIRRVSPARALGEFSSFRFRENGSQCVRIGQ